MSDAATHVPGRTVLVLAYTLSPVRGSEYAVGWNYVEHMSRRHRLVVLYGAAGDHIGDVEEITQAVVEQYRGRVEFVAVTPSRLTRLLNYPNRKGFFPFAFYLAYRDWHRTAARVARRIVDERHVDIVHYLCPIGFREPGYLWRLDRPYVWGPIGGMNARPLRPFFGLGWRIGMKTIVRNSVNSLQFRLNPRLRRAARRTDVLVVNTTENAALVRRVLDREPIIMPENGITCIEPVAMSGLDDEPLRLIWVGTIETRKALSILLNALGRLTVKNWRLDVVGDGPLAAMMKDLADELGVSDRVHWAGKVARTRAIELFNAAHVHVLTSLAEAHTTVLWEAMSLAIPTIAFDHCGMHDSICDGCGVRIPLGTIDEMQQRLSLVLVELITDRERVRSLSNGAESCAHRFGWDERVDQWDGIFDLAVRRHADRRAVEE